MIPANHHRLYTPAEREAIHTALTSAADAAAFFRLLAEAKITRTPDGVLDQIKQQRAPRGPWKDVPRDLYLAIERYVRQLRRPPPTQPALPDGVPGEWLSSDEAAAKLGTHISEMPRLSMRYGLRRAQCGRRQYYHAPSVAYLAALPKKRRDVAVTSPADLSAAERQAADAARAAAPGWVAPPTAAADRAAAARAAKAAKRAAGRAVLQSVETRAAEPSAPDALARLKWLLNGNKLGYVDADTVVAQMRDLTSNR